MIISKIISKKDYRRAAWKNGLGYTEEIAIYPENAELKRGNFLWRVSSARIEQASPFSAFPEHDRTLVVLKGEGVRLTHTFVEGEPEESVDLHEFTPYDFPGDVPSRCDLLGGPITDLSVFVRKAESEGVTEAFEISREEPFEWTPGARWSFIFAAEGSFNLKANFDGFPARLSELDTLRVELDRPLDSGQAVTITPVGDHGKIVIISLN